MKILSLKPRDIPALSEMTARVPLLLRYGWTQASASKILKRALSDRASDLLIAKDGRAIAGFAWVMRNAAFARSAYLRLIAVDQRYVRLGVGKRLMSAMERRHLKPNGLLLLTTSTNAPARKFYKSLGYRPIGTLKDYVRKGLTEVIYFKPPLRKI